MWSTTVIEKLYHVQLRSLIEDYNEGAPQKIYSGVLKFERRHMITCHDVFALSIFEQSGCGSIAKAS